MASKVEKLEQARTQMLSARAIFDDLRGSFYEAEGHDLEWRLSLNALDTGNVCNRLTMMLQERIEESEDDQPEPPDYSDEDIPQIPLELDPDLPHAHHSIEMQQNHMAVMRLVPKAEVTKTAVRSGLWSDDNVWDGSKPSDSDKVLIPEGIEVELDTAASVRWLRVEGTLTVEPFETVMLRFGELVGMPGSRVEIGTKDRPVQESAEFEVRDLGEFDLHRDPFQMGRAIIIHGEFSVCGSPVDPYAFCGPNPRSGDRQITFDPLPEGWKSGDKLVFPAIKNLSSDENEVRTIESTDGSMVTINEPLEHDHDLERYTILEGKKLPVARLTSNVVFRSENPDENLRRGHIMVMHSHKATVNHCLIEGMGRTRADEHVTDPQLDEDGEIRAETIANVRARYPLHYHLAGDTKDKLATCEGVIVHGSPKLGLVNHGSHVHFDKCVVYDVLGSALFAEDGSETGRFKDCWVSKCIRPGVKDGEWQRRETRDINPQGGDFGNGGSACWAQGGGVEFIDNLIFHSTNAFAHINQRMGGGTSTGYRQFRVANLDNPEDYDSEFIDMREVPVQFTGGMAVCVRNVLLSPRRSGQSECSVKGTMGVFEHAILHCKYSSNFRITGTYEGAPGEWTKGLEFNRPSRSPLIFEDIELVNVSEPLEQPEQVDITARNVTLRDTSNPIEMRLTGLEAREHTLENIQAEGTAVRIEQSERMRDGAAPDAEVVYLDGKRLDWPESEDEIVNYDSDGNKI